ncbi:MULTISPECIES: DUF555 domain-containing protein [Halolamina]|uniref:Uncharacterized protein, UPF0212 family n=1 Tax=Halolamina pelagica TaxID=699431 RepID=A0A1I5QQX5_9EURY|nr:MULTISPECIES: DUF555 domain-containing protein [Halolamina]NHX35498.1 DUF555 domain-containing protein [Halolamina sp. R1-12]SFP48622.1 Uncharacterized protein, UPF0212 family [Halolamina pelagica]
MDCRVVLEAAVPVYDVATPEAAVGAAISKVGSSLNPELSHVDIEPRSRRSPRGAELPPATVAAGEGLVALELAMTVYDVEGADHAVTIARSEIGHRLEGIPLERVSCTPVDDDEGESAEPEPAADEDGDDADDEATLLPEFEEMVERHRE